MTHLDLKFTVPEPVLNGLKGLEYGLDTAAKNPRICGILDQTVLKGGKRIRPLLTFLMGDLFGLGGDAIAAYAIDIERIHAATLAHDDVVDDASLRRGVPSINVVSTNKKAILAGDYLLAQVLHEVAQRGDPRIVLELSRVIAELAEGEWLQIENAENTALTWQDIEDVCRKKTGSVIRWCCVAPSLMSGMSDEIVSLCERLGEKIGVAFQLGDDVLDFKRLDGGQNADIKNKVVNSVLFEAFAVDGKIDARNLNLEALEMVDLDRAITRVRERMSVIISDAQKTFEHIVEHIGPVAKSGDATIIAIRQMLHYLLVRV